MKTKRRIICHGWMHKHEKDGFITVNLGADGGNFADTEVGAEEAARFVTMTLVKREVPNASAWKLEDMYFLGYRIFTEVEE